MKVIEIRQTEGNKYMLLNNDGDPVIPVVKYLKYLSNLGRAENTVKSYAYHLKLYFEFLSVEEIDYRQINIQTLATFISWLRTPFQTFDVIPIEAEEVKRSEKTVNIILTCVLGFYEFIERIEEHTGVSKMNVMKNIQGKYKNGSFKPFLHHISKSKPKKRNILKLKEPKQPVQTLQHFEIMALYKACNNIRDQLLLSILYEGGLRVGEAVCLWLEDININECSIRVRKSKTRAGVGRKVYVSKETINLLQSYILEYHTYDIDTNFLFYNFRGINKGKPFSLQGIYSLVKHLRKKTGIYFNPHMFRHTFATELHENGVDISKIQKLLGHANVQTTMQIYMHPSDKVLRESYENAQKNIADKRRTLHESQED